SETGSSNESLTVPRVPEHDEDPVIEYEDKCGRIRTARRSELPRHLLSTSKDQEIGDEDVIYNPVGFFPVYEPSAKRIKAVEEELAEARKEPEMHYDATKEVRAKGAAFYQFSADEDTRRQQMEELRSAREETKKTREEIGAVDVTPGEVEGMRAEDSSSSGSRALEKRKRDIETRRALLEAKRKKLKTDGEVPSSQSKSTSHTPVTIPSKDPFAALERQVPNSPPPQSKQATMTSDADAFLAQLEQEVLKKRK
ncbi:hypothetical protein EDD16DRAFT_1500199, partial [Pisolithus croceorrhizus]